MKTNNTYTHYEKYNAANKYNYNIINQSQV